jgi:hypothetical protein
MISSKAGSFFVSKIILLTQCKIITECLFYQFKNLNLIEFFDCSTLQYAFAECAVHLVYFTYSEVTA